MAINEHKRNDFMGRFVDDLGAVMPAATVVVGAINRTLPKPKRAEKDGGCRGEVISKVVGQARDAFVECYFGEPFREEVWRRSVPS